jgi:hypothetical protein
MEDQFFLRFMVALQLPDEFGHPLAVVGAMPHLQAIKHDLLHVAIFTYAFACIGYLCNSIAIPA